MALRFALTNILALVMIAGMIAGGMWVTLALVLLLVVGGPLDEAVGDDLSLLGPRARVFFDANLYATVPLLTAMTIVYLHYFAVGDPIGLIALLDGIGVGFNRTPAFASWGPPAIGLFALGAFYAQAGMNFAHELVHRTNSRLAVESGRYILAFVFGTTFSVAHVYGHHRYVGTDKDYTTARRGEYVLRFVIRAAPGEMATAFRHEAERLKRKGLSPWSLGNRAINGQFYTLAILAVSLWIGGPVGLLAVIGAGLFGRLLHEMANYIQHYGLVRAEARPIEARHSWDSYRKLSNTLSYNLPRHADHHLRPTAHGTELRPVVGAPMLPHGYKTMMARTLVPSLFHKEIDPLLADWDARLASEEERAIIARRGWEIRLPSGARPAAEPAE